MKLTSTQNREVNFITALVYGDSGIGKTTSLKTLPEAQTLITAAERGLLPLRSSNYPVVGIESWTDVRELVGKMREPTTMIEELRAAGTLGKDFNQIRILAIDSLSEFSELCKRHIVTTDRKVLMQERTKGQRDTPENVYDDLMTMEDWGLYGSRMRSMLSAVVHLPVHVVFTSLSQWTEDKRTGFQHRTPAVNGRLATEVPAFFDLVLHMEESKTAEGNDCRAWRTAHSDNITAKDASGALDAFELPNWTSVFSKILRTNGNKKQGAK